MIEVDSRFKALVLVFVTTWTFWWVGTRRHGRSRRDIVRYGNISLIVAAA